jgi:hypothetical protein
MRTAAGPLGGCQKEGIEARGYRTIEGTLLHLIGLVPHLCLNSRCQVGIGLSLTI